MERQREAGEIFAVVCDSEDFVLPAATRGAARLPVANDARPPVDGITQRRDAAMKHTLIRLPSISNKALMEVAYAAAPDPLPLDENGRPIPNIRATVGHLEARKAARAEIIDLIRVKLPTADYEAVFNAARACAPQLFQ